MPPRTPKAKAKAAPAVMTLECAKCGAKFTKARTGGRTPKYCPEHRRSRGQQRAEVAAQMREEAERRDLKEQRRMVEVPGKVSRLAAGLRVYRDPEMAAAAFGITERGKALERLTELARTTYPKVIDGDMSQTAQLAQAATHALLTDLLVRRAELPARDLPNALKQAATLASDLVPEGPQTNYTALHLGVMPPPADGKLTPEQRAKVFGTEADE